MKKEKNISIKKEYDQILDLVLDTIRGEKQCIIFVNTKKSAESLAQKISTHIKNIEFQELSQKILNALNTPTKQCSKLSQVIFRGVAFHHSGLVASQRDLIEENFKQKKIKIIVATPTLAMGVDLPAYRVIIKDVKRFGIWGMQYIPVLEYEQQAGRAGRPKYDTHGEAILVSESEIEKNELINRYINGSPEEIYSKLAVEPVMRTYILSLVSTGFISNVYNLEEFFKKIFYAFQYGDMDKLKLIINKMLKQLEEWNFIEIEKENKISKNFNDTNNSYKNNNNNTNDNFKNNNNNTNNKYNNKIKDDYNDNKSFVNEKNLDFISANEIISYNNIKIIPTSIGRRVSELYLDPYTANFLIKNLTQTKILEIKTNELDIGIIHLVTSCLELRPLLRVKSSEIDKIISYMLENTDNLLIKIPQPYSDEYDEFLSSIKTTKMFIDWLNEKDEEYLFENYNITPGELNSKKDRADWILYSMDELCKLLKLNNIAKIISKIRYRLKYGVKEELIPLLQLKNIGRVRARKLFNNKIQDIGDVKKCDITTLVQLIGKNVAIDIKNQVGQEFDPKKIEVKEHKRKGQISLNDY